MVSHPNEVVTVIKQAAATLGSLTSTRSTKAATSQPGNSRNCSPRNCGPRSEPSD